MSCLSWNCQGLGNRRVHALKRLVLSRDPIVIFLCKTKSSVDYMERLKSQLKFNFMFTAPSRGRPRGLCAMWKEEANFSLRSYSHNHLDFEMGGWEMHSIGELRSFMTFWRKLIDINHGRYYNDFIRTFLCHGFALETLMRYLLSRNRRGRLVKQ